MVAGISPILTEAIPGRVDADRDVARGDQAHAARIDIALHARDHRLWALVDRAQHRRKTGRVGRVFLVREIGRAAHPVEIRTGAERGPVGAEHDHSHVGRRARLRKGNAEFADDDVVEGIAQLGPVEPDARDGAFDGEFEGGERCAHDGERASCCRR
jgi:hypothetical protein